MIFLSCPHIVLLHTIESWHNLCLWGSISGDLNYPQPSTNCSAQHSIAVETKDLATVQAISWPTIFNNMIAMTYTTIKSLPIEAWAWQTTYAYTATFIINDTNTVALAANSKTPLFSSTVPRTVEASPFAQDNNQNDLWLVYLATVIT